MRTKLLISIVFNVILITSIFLLIHNCIENIIEIEKSKDIMESRYKKRIEELEQNIELCK